MLHQGDHSSKELCCSKCGSLASALASPGNCENGKTSVSAKDPRLPEIHPPHMFSPPPTHTYNQVAHEVQGGGTDSDYKEQDQRGVVMNSGPSRNTLI